MRIDDALLHALMARVAEVVGGSEQTQTQDGQSQSQSQAATVHPPVSDYALLDLTVLPSEVVRLVAELKSQLLAGAKRAVGS